MVGTVISNGKVKFSPSIIKLILPVTIRSEKGKRTLQEEVSRPEPESTRLAGQGKTYKEYWS